MSYRSFTDNSATFLKLRQEFLSFSEIFRNFKNMTQNISGENFTFEQISVSNSSFLKIVLRNGIKTKLFEHLTSHDFRNLVEA